jgi:hypothetical protein
MSYDASDLCGTGIAQDGASVRLGRRAYFDKRTSLLRRHLSRAYRLRHDIRSSTVNERPVNGLVGWRALAGAVAIC